MPTALSYLRCHRFVWHSPGVLVSPPHSHNQLIDHHRAQTWSLILQLQLTILEDANDAKRIVTASIGHLRRYLQQCHSLSTSATSELVPPSPCLHHTGRLSSEHANITQLIQDQGHQYSQRLNHCRHQFQSNRPLITLLCQGHFLKHNILATSIVIRSLLGTTSRGLVHLGEIRMENCIYRRLLSMIWQRLLLW